MSRHHTFTLLRRLLLQLLPPSRAIAQVTIFVNYTTICICNCLYYCTKWMTTAIRGFSNLNKPNFTVFQMIFCILTAETYPFAKHFFVNYCKFGNLPKINSNSHYTVVLIFTSCETDYTSVYNRVIVAEISI